MSVCKPPPWPRRLVLLASSLHGHDRSGAAFPLRQRPSLTAPPACTHLTHSSASMPEPCTLKVELPLSECGITPTYTMQVEDDEDSSEFSVCYFLRCIVVDDAEEHFWNTGDIELYRKDPGGERRNTNVV